METMTLSDQCPLSHHLLSEIIANAWKIEKANVIGKEHFGMEKKGIEKYRKWEAEKRETIWEKSVRC